jgi:Flp pilus assembly protein TadD
MKLILALFVAFLAGCSTMQPGIDALNRGDLNTAEANFRQALQNGDTMAWNNLGVVYQRRGETDKAIQHFTMAARWGHQLAQQNLANLGAPIPAPDLASERSNRNAADTASTLMLMRALQPRPAPAYRPPINCQSFRVGNQISTRCD